MSCALNTRRARFWHSSTGCPRTTYILASGRQCNLALLLDDRIIRAMDLALSVLRGLGVCCSHFRLLAVNCYWFSVACRNGALHVNMLTGALRDGGHVGTPLGPRSAAEAFVQIEGCGKGIESSHFSRVVINRGLAQILILLVTQDLSVVAAVHVGISILIGYSVGFNQVSTVPITWERGILKAVYP